MVHEEKTSHTEAPQAESTPRVDYAQSFKELLDEFGGSSAGEAQKRIKRAISVEFARYCERDGDESIDFVALLKSAPEKLYGLLYRSGYQADHKGMLERSHHLGYEMKVLASWCAEREGSTLEEKAFGLARKREILPAIFQDWIDSRFDSLTTREHDAGRMLHIVHSLLGGAIGYDSEASIWSRVQAEELKEAPPVTEGTPLTITDVWIFEPELIRDSVEIAIEEGLFSTRDLTTIQRFHSYLFANKLSDIRGEDLFPLHRSERKEKPTTQVERVEEAPKDIPSTELKESSQVKLPIIDVFKETLSGNQVRNYSGRLRLIVVQMNNLDPLDLDQAREKRALETVQRGEVPTEDSYTKRLLFGAKDYLVRLTKEQLMLHGRDGLKRVSSDFTPLNTLLRFIEQESKGVSLTPEDEILQAKTEATFPRIFSEFYYGDYVPANAESKLLRSALLDVAHCGRKGVAPSFSYEQEEREWEALMSEPPNLDAIDQERPSLAVLLATNPDIVKENATRLFANSDLKPGAKIRYQNAADKFFAWCEKTLPKITLQDRGPGPGPQDTV